MPNIIETTICRFFNKTNWEKHSLHDKQNLFFNKSRTLFTSKPILQRSGKDLMLLKEKSLVIYKFKYQSKIAKLGKLPATHKRKQNGMFKNK